MYLTNLEVDLLMNYLPFIIPFVVIHIGLLVTAIIHIMTHKHYRIGNRIIWLAIVICIQIFGSILYFVIGRSDEGSDE